MGGYGIVAEKTLRQAVGARSDQHPGQMVRAVYLIKCACHRQSRGVMGRIGFIALSVAYDAAAAISSVHGFPRVGRTGQHRNSMTIWRRRSDRVQAQAARSDDRRHRGSLGYRAGGGAILDAELWIEPWARGSRP